MESTLMPIFLEEHLFAFGLPVPRLLRVFEILFQSLFLWQSTSSLNLLTFLFTGNFRFLVSLDSSKFSKPPSIKLGWRIDTIRVIDIDDFLFLFLYKNVKSDIHM
jgi:hypothetical protein